MTTLSKDNFISKQLTSEEQLRYEELVNQFNNLFSVLQYISELITENEEEELEKAQYILSINNQKELIAKIILEEFYDRQE
jgi:hypothetical protein